MEKKKQKKAKLNYRGIIAIIVIIVVIVAIVIFATRKSNKNNQQQTPVETYKTEEDGTKFNTSTKLQETKTFNGYEISEISLKETEGEVEFSAKIKNVTQNSIGNKSIYIVFKTQSGEELYKMQVYLGEIKPEKSTTISSKITKDIIGAYDLEIQF